MVTTMIEIAFRILLMLLAKPQVVAMVSVASWPNAMLGSASATNIARHMRSAVRLWAAWSELWFADMCMAIFDFLIGMVGKCRGHLIMGAPWLAAGQPAGFGGRMGGGPGRNQKTNAPSRISCAA